MSALRRCLGVALLAMLASPAIALLPAAYSGAPISGQIADAQTNVPIKGAVIVASWMISPIYYFHGPTSFRVIGLMESLSDEDGNYTIPGWGPVARPIGWEKFDISDPLLAVFKPGYEPELLTNAAWKTREATGPSFNDRDASLLRSVHDRRIVHLFRYHTRKPDQERPANIRLTPETELLGKLDAFVTFLERNAEYADELGAPMNSPLRQDGLRRQREAVLTVDRELKRLGRTHNWRTKADFLREE